MASSNPLIQVGRQHGSGPDCRGEPDQDINGNALPRSPEWSFSAGVEYAREFTGGVLTSGTTTGRTFSHASPISWGVRLGYRFQGSDLPWVD